MKETQEQSLSTIIECSVWTGFTKIFQNSSEAGVTNTAVTLHTLQQIGCEHNNRFPFDFGIIAILITCLSLFYVLVHDITLNCLLGTKNCMPKLSLETKHNCSRCDKNVTTSSTSKPHLDTKFALGKPFLVTWQALLR